MRSEIGRHGPHGIVIEIAVPRARHLRSMGLVLGALLTADVKSLSVAQAMSINSIIFSQTTAGLVA